MTMFPLLLVALLVWAGIFAFIFGVDRKLSALEKQVSQNDTEGQS